MKGLVDVAEELARKAHHGTYLWDGTSYIAHVERVVEYVKTKRTPRYKSMDISPALGEELKLLSGNIRQPAKESEAEMELLRNRIQSAEESLYGFRPLDEYLAVAWLHDTLRLDNEGNKVTVYTPQTLSEEGIPEHIIEEVILVGKASTSHLIQDVARRSEARECSKELRRSPWRMANLAFMGHTFDKGCGVKSFRDSTRIPAHL